MIVTATSYYKVLCRDGSCYHGGSGRWRVGRWQEVKGELVPCQRGLHVLTQDQLINWLGPAIHPVEVHPDARIDTSQPDKTVVSKARLGPALTTWTERTQRLFAADCAEHVLPLFERQHPNDDRPRRAIEAASALARGELDAEAARAAAAAAHAASAYAAAAAHSYAAASYAGAYAASYAAACVHAAARSAAARAAAAAARAAERAWQTECLWQYLHPKRLNRDKEGSP